MAPMTPVRLCFSLLLVFSLIALWYWNRSSAKGRAAVMPGLGTDDRCFVHFGLLAPES